MFLLEDRWCESWVEFVALVGMIFLFFRIFWLYITRGVRRLAVHLNRLRLSDSEQSRGALLVRAYRHIDQGCVHSLGRAPDCTVRNSSGWCIRFDTNIMRFAQGDNSICKTEHPFFFFLSEPLWIVTSHLLYEVKLLNNRHNGKHALVVTPQWSISKPSGV